MKKCISLSILLSNYWDDVHINIYGVMKQQATSKWSKNDEYDLIFFFFFNKQSTLPPVGGDIQTANERLHGKSSSRRRSSRPKGKESRVSSSGLGDSGILKVSLVFVVGLTELWVLWCCCVVVTHTVGLLHTTPSLRVDFAAPSVAFLCVTPLFGHLWRDRLASR